MACKNQDVEKRNKARATRAVGFDRRASRACRWTGVRMHSHCRGAGASSTVHTPATNPKHRRCQYLSNSKNLPRGVGGRAGPGRHMHRVAGHYLPSPHCPHNPHHLGPQRRALSTHRNLCCAATGAHMPGQGAAHASPTSHQQQSMHKAASRAAGAAPAAAGSR